LNVKRLLPFAALSVAWCLACAPAQAKMAMCAKKNALWGKFLQASGSKLSDALPSPDFAVASGGYGYETAMGRASWPSRDPIGERGGVNLYGTVGNDIVNGYDILGNRWTSGDAGGDKPFPPPMPTIERPEPKTGDEAFHQALNDYFVVGDDKHWEMGPDHPWTQDLKRHPHMDRVDFEVTQMIHSHCKGFSQIELNRKYPSSFSLNNQSVKTNVLHLMRDTFAFFHLAPAQFSMGSFAMTYEFKSIDCSRCQAKVAYDAADRLRFGSMTRIPFTNIELGNDDPFGPDGAFGTVYLHWFWEATETSF